ncbi:MAG: transposase [Bacteroidota bacterium]
MAALKEEAKGKKPIRGKPKRSEAHNLLLALNNYHREVLDFLTHPAVPFDNNQAESDLRMIKTQQKISGCFRSTQAGEAFATIRGFVSTLKKQRTNLFDGFNLYFNPQNISSSSLIWLNSNKFIGFAWLLEEVNYYMLLYQSLRIRVKFSKN